MANSSGEFIFDCVLFFVLPIINLLHGLLIMVPVILIMFVGLTVTMLCWILPDVAYTFWTVWKTPRWGINMKCMVTLIVPPAIILWVVSVPIISIFVGFFYGLFGPMVHGYIKYFNCDKHDNEKDYIYHCCGGPSFSVLKNSSLMIKEFWKNNKQYNSMLKDFRTVANADGSVFEISLLNIFVGLFIVIIAGTINTICLFVILIFLYPLYTFGMYRLYKKNMCCCDQKDECCCWLSCMCILPIFIVGILIIFVGPLMLILSPFYAFYGAIKSALYSCNREQFNLSIPYDKEFVCDVWHQLTAIGFNRECDYPTPLMDEPLIQKPQPLNQPPANIIIIIS